MEHAIARGGDQSLVVLARRAFGSYAAAREAAGLHGHFVRPFLTEIEIGSFLRRLDKAGVCLTHDAVVTGKAPDARFLIRSVRSRFPSLAVAVVAAGLAPVVGAGGQQRFPDKAGILREIQRLHDAGEHPEIGIPGRGPSGTIFDEDARKQFGSWAVAVREAGLEPVHGGRGKPKVRRARGLPTDVAYRVEG